MNRRLSLVFIIFLVLFAVIYSRLFFWQVISAESLKGFAQSQTGRSRVVKAKRGSIFSSDESPLVINQPSFLIYAQPHLVKDKLKLTNTLSEILEIDEASISAKLEDSVELKWVSLAEKIEAGKAGEIKEKNLAGIGLSQDFKRYYPESSMAAHLLGFVGKNHNGQDQGYFGLEGYYDEQLKGRTGLINEEKDALGNPILAGLREIIAPNDGNNLYLTVDKTVQFIVEEKLKKGMEKYGAAEGTVVVMNPQTGALRAMASYPSYDLISRENFNTRLYKNPAVSSSFEPGSTFKVLIMAAAINENSVSPNDEYDESGPLELGAYTIKTWDQKYHGLIKIPQILQYSSNVGMVYISEKLGNDKMFSYLDNLGMGRLTGIDLQDESSPDLRSKDSWKKIDFATASFGQGIAVTPLQMIRMVSAIANGGKLVKPYIVDRIIDFSGRTISNKPQIVKKIFKKETASIVTEMMVNAVEKGETKFLKPVGIRIAGKTGTAQIPIAGHYDTQKTIASFVGFFPADDPKLIMLVTLREPTSSPWGSETAAPLFFDISKELIKYYNLPLSN
ncbi:hypothetical protein A3D05_04975 [Candidatus Gottesmanbacteria bacterium RIFCSPHIGHO2_02_FULL_40_24]|uniref:Penicillin-binding protein transpeptidase domain-containing protein n=1 Tax=Candidatus Gottesmanbacteria bacterium RIFCSPHIGHO2_01_FULL_40_15 TaxID=1798376 RepID=A0A1F5Z2B0_9BACT|nr:MAG: hypothetical protein A2777_06005 [Candidatus Gottesmanbacteria bacterium RIFCSPHIGHO2_01_FULL_40_15]OGG16224.1 MAG: hypothetical protein A3D05_04975 [Candidatus Gottesmanbacteria bacterium RIFCSPHIGHO2_02_FULL_40_24]OGG32307.1 MAG: hypothetical protein A3I80_03315 [Candidatus Gottesmanbacteria bacterium RIFCSPLOWO2_02_FULL_40_10]